MIQAVGKRMDAYEVLKYYRDIIPSDKAPINLYPLVDELNIELKDDLDRENLNNIGYIKKQKDGKVIIWLNPLQNHLETRRRFTLAHELGHYFLHILPNGNEFFADDEKTMRRSALWDTKEFQANTFAAQILMPKDLLVDEGMDIVGMYQEKYHDNPTTKELINMMAKRFEVSAQAMEYRLKNIGLIRGD